MSLSQNRSIDPPGGSKRGIRSSSSLSKSTSLSLSSSSSALSAQTIPRSRMQMESNKDSTSPLGVRTGVGLLVCLLSAAILCTSSPSDDTWRLRLLVEFLPLGWADVTRFSWMQQNQRYHVLTILAGYLILDLLWLNPNSSIRIIGGGRSIRRRRKSSNGLSLDELEDLMTFVFVAGIVWKVEETMLPDFDGIVYALIAKITIKILVL